MPVMNTKNNYLILDIETITANDAELFMPELKEPRITKDGKPDGRDKTIEQQKAEWLEKSALRPLTGQVAVLGVNINGEIMQDAINFSEEENIRYFWKKDFEPLIKKGYSIIGFNIKKFDLPFLSIRGLKYGIKPAWNYDDKFNKQVKDISEYFSQGNYDWKYTKCNDVFKYFGLGEKLADGSDFGKLWETDKEKALAYNNDELIKLEQIAKLIYF